ncbi:hypothetical protein [Congregibacter litoralis]|nr:hypothetical protein [Congregibacter litoralis]
MSEDRRQTPRDDTDRRRETRQNVPTMGWLVVWIAVVAAFVVIWTQLPS